MSAAACTCYQSSKESKTTGHHSNTNPKINLQAQTITDSAQHIMVLRLTFRPLSHIIQLFSSNGGGAKKLSILIIAAKGPWENPREASSTAEETTGEEAGGNQWQIKPSRKSPRRGSSWKVHFVWQEIELGFLQGISAQSCLPVWKPWVWGTHHPRMATNMGGEFSSSREGRIFLYWWARKGSPHISTHSFAKLSHFKVNKAPQTTWPLKKWQVFHPSQYCHCQWKHSKNKNPTC